jgi:hypothetical protein
VSRLTLANGDWADFDERLNYAQARRVQIAQGTVDYDATFLCAIVKNWALRDKYDQPIPFPPQREPEGIPLEALWLVPIDTYMELVIFSAKQMKAIEDPKDTGETSTERPQDKGSKSRRTSSTPSSSPTIQDGTGTISNPPPLM